MADYNSMATTIRTSFNTAWTAKANGAVAIPDNLFNADEYPPGTTFPPVDSNGNPLPWVRLTLTPALIERSTMGGTGARYLSQGLVVVEIFSPVNRGPSQAENLCDDAISVFRNFNVSNVRIDSPYPVRVGIVDEVYYKYNVEARWLHFDVAA